MTAKELIAQGQEAARLTGSNSELMLQQAEFERALDAALAVNAKKAEKLMWRYFNDRATESNTIRALQEIAI